MLKVSIIEKKKINSWKGNWGREYRDRSAMGKTKNSAVQGASGAGVGRVLKSTAGLRAGHHLSQKLHRVGSEHCLSRQPLHISHGPASSKLEAARHVTCLQKETSGINIAVEGFIIVSGLEFGAKSLGVVVAETMEDLECYSTSSHENGEQHSVTGTRREPRV